MKGDRFIIRMALERDLAFLLYIEREAAQIFEQTPYAFIKDSETLPIKAFQTHLQQGELCVAVDEADLPVGFAIVSEIDNCAYLKEIDVCLAFMRRGIGSQLVEFACKMARVKKYNRIYLSTFIDVPWNAPFYTKLGFAIVDESQLSPGFQQLRQKEVDPGFIGEKRVIMRRELSARAAVKQN